VVVERVGANHFGSEQETGEQKAQRIVLEEMKQLGREEVDPPQRRKGDQEKVVAARRLRQETTMTLKWIALKLMRICYEPHLPEAFNDLAIPNGA